MLRPSSGRPTRLVAGSGGCSSSLKKPATSSKTASSSSLSSGSGLRTSSRVAGNFGANKSSRQTSQSSLCATATGGCGGKSTSRSSIMSDTTNSVCSSLNQSNNNNSTIKSTKTTTSMQQVFSFSAQRDKTGPQLLASKTNANRSSGSQVNARKVPTLAMSLREKDQQIKLLIKERDEHKFQAELLARRAEEWEEKFLQSEVEKSHVTSEADDEVVELRRLTQELEDENKRLGEQIGEKEQIIGDTQFKLDELECERDELKNELNDKEEQFKMMEQENREILLNGKPVAQVTTERAISKAKYEREIEELKEKILNRDEQMIQLRTSLEMRKNEVTNLQTHSGDLERKLKIECERSERHLKRIDEVNLELKATEAKLTTKTEENEMQEKQVRQLRQELRSAEEKLEQISLARKKDVDILHSKLSAARRGSTTPTSPQPYKTPTPQDEIVRLQMEIRELKDQLIDREAELDCNRRDIEVMRRKMETRTLEVDCNNQELARRCQDLLEQNRQSEDTVKQLLKSTTEHSAQLMRATEDLKEANGKCIKLREDINKLENKLEEQIEKASNLNEENKQFREENEEYKQQVDILRQQVESLNEQLSELCEQLDLQTSSLHKDREVLADQLSQNEIDSAQLRHDLATARQDLRTSKLQTQEVASERDRLKADLGVKEKYVASRNDIIETLRHELDDCKKSLMEYKQKLDDLRQNNEGKIELVSKEIKTQLEHLKKECQEKNDELVSLRDKCNQLKRELEESQNSNEEEELQRFDEMRQKHSAELDVLNLKLTDLEEQLDEAKSSTLTRVSKTNDTNKNDEESMEKLEQTREEKNLAEDKTSTSLNELSAIGKQRREEYETQIEFLNSVVVDMQRKCDDYKNRLSQIETVNIMSEFDNLIMSNQPVTSSIRASTLKRNPQATLPQQQEEKRQQVVSNTLKRSIQTDHKDPVRISGRPYCDVCNVYDLHHTIYCPKVSEKLTSHQVADSYGANNNNYIDCKANGKVDEVFREYEQSIKSASILQFSSLRRPQAFEKPPRPYCDHCDLFGHTIKSCQALKV